MCIIFDGSPKSMAHNSAVILSRKYSGQVLKIRRDGWGKKLY